MVSPIKSILSFPHVPPFLRLPTDLKSPTFSFSRPDHVNGGGEENLNLSASAAQQEALDLEDSDLSSFIRASKRQAVDSFRSGRTLALNPSPSTSILRSCSQLHQPQGLTSSHHTSGPQTLPSPRLPRQPESSSRRIPGPAGTVQAAMRRKVRDSELPVQGDNGEAPIPTQEYIRRAVENGDEDDGDFALNPWVCAVDFVRRGGLVDGDGVAIGTPLCAIKKGHLTDRVPQVVAIIKSCNSNGLGDLMVTLKDPTGSTGASIHRRVLNYGSFGKEISVGAVLILQKVAVFSAARSARYLNITLNNVVKVISKEIGPLSQQTYHAPTLKHTSVEENYEKSNRQETAVSQWRTRVDGIMSGFRRGANTLASRHSEKSEMVQAVDSYSKLSPREHSSCREKGNVPIINDADSISGEAETDVLMTDSNARGVSFSVEGTKEANHVGHYSTDNSTKGKSWISKSKEVSGDAEGGNTSVIKEQREAVVSRISLPEWTDEQLEELLEYD